MKPKNALASKKRNGTIELMRFVFCMEVILYHIVKRVELPTWGHFNFFLNGKIGVEFFFLVSGYLLAMSAKKQTDVPIAYSTKHFMFRKVFAILPCHIIAFIICITALLAYQADTGLFNLAKIAVTSIPSFLFIQKTGIPGREVIRPEWYIEAMLWAMLVVYPLLLKFRDKFSKIACPIIAVFLVGYMIHTTNRLGGTGRYVFGDTIAKVYVRAFGELCGGIFCFEAAQWLKGLQMKKAGRVCLTLMEFLCYAATLVYTVTDINDQFEGYFFYVLAVAITLSFSELTLTAEWAKTEAVYYLGRVSLPFYMAQTLPFTMLKYSARVQAMSPWMQVLFCVALSVGVGLVVYYLSIPFTRWLKKQINQKLGRPFFAAV